MLGDDIAKMIYQNKLSSEEIEVLMFQHSKRLNANLVTGANLAYIELCYLFAQTGAKKYGSVWRALLSLEDVLNIPTEKKYTDRLIRRGEVSNE